MLLFLWGAFPVVAVTADGVAVAIVVGATAIGLGLTKLAGPAANTIREVGFALVEVRGRMRRELSATSAKVDESIVQIEAMKLTVSEAKAEADRKIAEALELADRKYDLLMVQAARIRAEAEDAAWRRKHEREFQQRMVLRLEEQVRHLSSTDRRLEDHVEPRVARNEAAIDAISVSTQIPVPPAPDAAGGGAP